MNAIYCAHKFRFEDRLKVTLKYVIHYLQTTNKKYVEVQHDMYDIPNRNWATIVFHEKSEMFNRTEYFTTALNVVTF